MDYQYYFISSFGIFFHKLNQLKIIVIVLHASIDILKSYCRLNEYNTHIYLLSTCIYFIQKKIFLHKNCKKLIYSIKWIIQVNEYFFKNKKENFLFQFLVFILIKTKTSSCILSKQKTNLNCHCINSLIQIQVFNK